ncbi:MAG: NifU family protein [Chitinophagales bacterium]|nr:NifU family protein [Chitinophagales bacterium]HMV15453.1 NifU family protein [Chitinophagales bacterium]HMW13179.1 NifU family protein [Chitinophagales bacterium]HMX59646.1 NifU family protein [Chitinophagales bacterium]HMY22268.1 NifU family protein [Chitinophagales bacterium]
MDNTTIKPVMIYTESTPNPNTLKFVTNKALLLNDAVEFQNIEETTEAPLAKALFGFDGVSNVFITNNFVTITKTDEHIWHEMMIPIKDFLKKYIDEGQTILSDNFVKPTKTATNTINDDDSDVEIRIKGALDKYVKPAVEMDGGNISFVSFEDGKLTLQLQGSCSGCPSSTVTLKQGIENLLKRFVPEVQEVVAENE